MAERGGGPKGSKMRVIFKEVLLVLKTTGEPKQIEAKSIESIQIYIPFIISRNGRAIDFATNMDWSIYDFFILLVNL